MSFSGELISFEQRTIGSSGAVTELLAFFALASLNNSRFDDISVSFLEKEEPVFDDTLIDRIAGIRRAVSNDFRKGRGHRICSTRSKRTCNCKALIAYKAINVNLTRIRSDVSGH